jgi:hypothetical protein
MGSEEEACRAAEEVIERLGVQRIVIGHTVTKSGSIETRCDGLIHMIDVGMSALYGWRTERLDVHRGGRSGCDF